jgi:PPM family protein phosphatase
MSPAAGHSGIDAPSVRVMQLIHAANTHVGMVRTGNEDAYLAEATPDRGIYIVADGMGGHAAGEIASAMAVEIMSEAIRGSTLPVTALKSVATEAVLDANRQIFGRTIEEPEKHGMGTTLTTMVVGEGRYMIAHVGDSRVYRLRGNILEQITVDHSYVQEQVDAGYLTPEQARYHPFSNVITRCVGVATDVEPTIYEGELQDGDLYMLATDGLTGMVDDAGLLKILTARKSPGPMVDALLWDANRAGGVDNITAVVVQISIAR